MNKRYLHPPYKLFFTFLFLLLTHLLPAQIITTVAGGRIGDGKPAIACGLVTNNGIAVDAADNLFIAENVNHRIRKVAAATGIISTFAGTGYLGYSGDSGLAINARVQIPYSITADTAGNIYFTDENRIRKVTTATGIITTIAGTGTAGFSGDGGPAINAQLGNPRSITTDAAGNVYMADNNSNRIRKITAATGIITTVAGTGVSGSAGDGGPATAAQLAYSSAVVADAAGNLYLSDNNRIRKVTAATGIINTIAGMGTGSYVGDGGNAYYATFYNARHLALSITGNLYIHDFNNYVIRKIVLASNIISTMAGNHTMGTSGIGGPVSDAQLFSSNSLAVDRQGNIYLTDANNNKVYRIDATTDTISTVAGTGKQGGNHGNGGPATAANILNPSGVVVDSIGNFYFLDNGLAVRKVTIATGIISTVAGNGIQRGYSGDGGPATSAKINRASGLAFDVAGNLYIADKDNNVIRKVNAATGTISTVAGTGTAGYSGDGLLATAATLNKPFAVTVDRNSNIYISDNTNNVIRRVDAITGIITTVAGTGTGDYSGDGGPATAAMIWYPYGLTTDTAGNVYVADQFNLRIRKITVATGIITTIAGTGLNPFNGDNIPPTTANVDNPVGVCFDTTGNLLIAELGNYRIRKIIYADTIPAPRIAVNNLSLIGNNAELITTKMYPNPAREQVIISLNGTINGKTTITLTDMWGKVLINQQKVIQQSGAFTTTLPLKQLPKGIYFVTVYMNQTKQVHKLVVQ